jgi:hypothetical protein
MAVRSGSTAVIAINSEEVTPMQSPQAADSMATAALHRPMTKPNRSRYQIVPIGSLQTGFALKVDGVIRRSAPDMLSLAAWVDAVLAGADEREADVIAQAIAVRAWPSYEERLAVSSARGYWRPAADPFDP